MNLKVLIVGSGGREHALAKKVAESALVSKVYVGPGNGGTEALEVSSKISNVECDKDSPDSVLKVAKTYAVSLVCIGPEVPLVLGVVDLLHKNGVPCYGPSKIASRLEGSKAFAKDFMLRNSIPTADYKVFKKGQNDEAKKYLYSCGFDVVVKASGLCAGKGVFIPESIKEAEEAIDFLLDGEVSLPDSEIVVEERLYGEELSVLAFCDGEHAVLMPPAQDHKRVFDGDKGKNTGGMGAYAPAPMGMNDKLREEIHATCVNRTLAAARKEGFEFRGTLFVGVIVTSTGPKVLEYNCRFGDPETQSLLPLLKSDLVPILFACVPSAVKTLKLDDGQSSVDQFLSCDLKSVAVEWQKNLFCCNVVATSNGYPGKYDKGMEIVGLENLQDPVSVIHAGTTCKDGKVYTNGGRVFSVVSLGSSLQSAISEPYKYLGETVKFPGMHFRKDIGYRAIKPPIKLGVLGSTRGTSMQYVIDAIEKGWIRATIEIVISNKTSSGILDRAEKHGIKTQFYSAKGLKREEFDAKVTSCLKEHKVDLILAIGYMRILSDSFVKTWWGKTLNVHPSLLPDFAGGMDLQVHQAVVDAKKEFSGCTVHYITEEVDGGPIAVQKRCKVLSNDTAESLKARVQPLEGPAFVEAIYRHKIDVPKE